MEFKDLRESLQESAELNPAALLVLKRRGIRVFPDGQRVALYTNEKYNLTFMVPFGGAHPSVAANPLMPVKEETVNEYTNVLGKVASVVANLPKAIDARKKAEAEKVKTQREKQSAQHRANREKQLKRAMQNRQKRQQSDLVSAIRSLKTNQGNNP